jgi:Transaldolase
MAKSNLHLLSERGQSVWIDSLSRHMLDSGGLKQLMKDDAVVGVTTNPTIFQKAIAQGGDYDEQLKELLESESDPKEIFLQLSSRDVGSGARRALAGAREESAGRVRLVGGRPDAAYDSEGTFDEAMRLFEWIPSRTST